MCVSFRYEEVEEGAGGWNFFVRGEIDSVEAEDILLPACENLSFFCRELVFCFYKKEWIKKKVEETWAVTLFGRLNFSLSQWIYNVQMLENLWEMLETRKQEVNKKASILGS